MFKRDITDFQLTLYLKNKKATDIFVQIEVPPVTEYRSKDGALVAIVVYDNRECRRLVYTVDLG